LRGDVPNIDIAPKVDPQFAAEVVDRAREAKQQQANVEAASARLRELQHDIKERLREKNLRRVNANGASVVWSAVKGRTSYDMKAIRELCAAAGIDLAPFEQVGDPTDRLTITLNDR
jgi:aspartate/methionine/tyrosine aminotransferase